MMDTLFGRQQELKQLNNFINNNPSGVKLLLGAKGVGKTALLQNWVQKIPTSIYYSFDRDVPSSLSLSCFYEYLLSKIKNLFNPTINVCGSTDSLRSCLYSTLSTIHPFNLLVIVLDGLDEVEVFDPFFSKNLNDNIFIISSALSINGMSADIHEDWADNPLILKPLTKNGVFQWIQSTGCQLNPDTVFSITHGYPIAIKYLINSNSLQDYLKTQLNYIDFNSSFYKFFSLLLASNKPVHELDLLEYSGMTEWDLVNLPWGIKKWLILSGDVYTVLPVIKEGFLSLLAQDIGIIAAYHYLHKGNLSYS